MIIIDVEIKKAILGRNEEPLPGIEYCAGWRDFANMGISCVCTYDTDKHLSRVFLEEGLGELFEYLRDKPTAGFNTKRFDVPLLAHHWLALGRVKDKDSIGCPHYDILEQIWLALGLNPDRFVPTTHGGWGLDAVCQATLGIAKTGHGALAPVWWQQGQHGRVIDYCLNDCHLEGTLLQWIIDGKPVTNGKQTIRVAPPSEAIPRMSPGDAYALGYYEGSLGVASSEDRIRGNGSPPVACQNSSTSKVSASVGSVSSGGLGLVRGK